MKPKHIREASSYAPHKVLPWIGISTQGSPYFQTENGDTWTPVGQNDAVNWPELNDLFKRRNLPGVEEYLIRIKGHGVTVLRLMLEYSQNDRRYLERPVGHFQPNMIQFWDDLFDLCEKHQLRILLTPFDTYWMWLRWKYHPYNKKNGGSCLKRKEWFISTGMMESIKNRFSFAIERWGSSGALFSWDLWNEIHPAHCDGKTSFIETFISEISDHVRNLEMKLYGKSHLQTVSIFGPHLYTYPEMANAIFRNPRLDFATSHFYDTASINNPKDSIAAAIVTGKLVQQALEHIPDNRPFFDSEHGPIHAFKNRKRTLAEPFDDEYFKHMQWAHMASGGAGGGMRWPYRHPHTLTPGMRNEQLKLSRFLPLIDWNNFHRKNLNREVRVSTIAFAAFCCGDKNQAVLYLLRKDNIKKKQINLKATALQVKVLIPGLSPGRYSVTEFDTSTGNIKNVRQEIYASSGDFLLKLNDVVADLAVAIRKYE